MRRVILCFIALLGLSACAADSVYAPQEAVDAARFVAEPPTSITLYTVINNRSGAGAHTGLLINASHN